MGPICLCITRLEGGRTTTRSTARFPGKRRRKTDDNDAPITSASVVVPQSKLPVSRSPPGACKATRTAVAAEPEPPPPPPPPGCVGGITMVE